MLGKLSSSTVAQHIDASNAALPVTAAAVRPESILKPHRAKQFIDVASRIKESQPDASELPKPCYKVKRNLEPGLRRALLKCGMAIAMPESQILRCADGSLLLSGAFGVTHTSGLLRFSFDRRGPNLGEHRLGWAGLATWCSVLLSCAGTRGGDSGIWYGSF